MGGGGGGLVTLLGAESETAGADRDTAWHQVTLQGRSVTLMGASSDTAGGKR